MLADLPDFQPTPASRKLVQDQDLAARARLRVALDDRTANADLGIVAEDRVLTVTYMPRQDEVGQALPDVLGDLEGCRKLDCTMAETTILLMQEQHGADQKSFQQVMAFAPRWGAAVELLRWTPDDRAPASLVKVHRVGANGSALGESARVTSGIYDEHAEDMDEDGLGSALDALVAAGCSGGGRTVSGNADQVLEVIEQEPNHSLVVVGDVFLTKGASAKTRETRELVRVFQERLKCPVITI